MVEGTGVLEGTGVCLRVQGCARGYRGVLEGTGVC